MYIKNVFARLWYEPSSKKKIYHKMACTDGCRNRMHVVTGSGSRIDRLKMRESTSALGILAKILRPFKLQLNVFFFFLNTEGKRAPQCDWQTLPVWDVREWGAGGAFISARQECVKGWGMSSLLLSAVKVAWMTRLLYSSWRCLARWGLKLRHFTSYTHTHTHTRSVTVSGTTTLTFWPFLK